MYCPICGAQSPQGFNFCKRCGANLGSPPAQAEPANISLKLVIPFLAAITIVTSTGILLPLAAPSELAYKGYPPDFIGAMVVLGVSAVVAIDAALIWLLLRLLKLSQPAPQWPQSFGQVAGQRAPAQIDSPPPELTSVTEHTTRNFEPAETINPARVGRGRATQ